MYRLVALILAMGLLAAAGSSAGSTTILSAARSSDRFARAEQSLPKNRNPILATPLPTIQRSFRVIDDEEITSYLNTIGQRIVKHLPPTNLRFKFMLVDIPDANAFVLPGGRVYVSRKLVSWRKAKTRLPE